MRRFDTSPRRAAPKGQTFITCTAPSQRSSLINPSSSFVAHTKEQMFGYDLIECADLDEAIEVASKHPVAAIGAIEVRPFWTE